jgi:DNA-binding HxlR family transcriptional regulator
MKTRGQEDKQKTMKDCSTKILAVRDALEIFSGKWKIPIIGALIYLQKSGFKELQRMVGDITPKMLSKELKELEVNHLVKRTVLDTRPVTVQYSITEYGKTCQSVIFELYQWGEQHRKKIKEEC